MTDIHLSILNRKFFSFFLPSLILTYLYPPRTRTRTPARTRTHTHTMVRLLWTRDRPIREIPLPDNSQHSQERDRHPSSQWDSNPQSSQMSSCRPNIRPHSQWHWHKKYHFVTLELPTQMAPLHKANLSHQQKQPRKPVIRGLSRK